MLVKEERPLLFFSLIALFFFALATALALPIVVEYMMSGLVPRLPTAVLITGISVCSVVCMLVGFVLDSIASAKKEARRQVLYSIVNAKKAHRQAHLRFKGFYL